MVRYRSVVSGIGQAVLWSSGTNPKMSFSLRSSFLPKKWRKWRFFEGQKRHFPLFGARASKHKPLIWLLLCRPTFLAPASKKNVGRHFRAKTLSTPRRGRVRPDATELGSARTDAYPAGMPQSGPRGAQNRQIQKSGRRQSPRRSAHAVAAHPKLRHGVTPLQGLDLRVTHFFGPRRLAPHPLNAAWV